MRRRKKQQEHENHERWLVSYADFMTLLFAFFTVLYATSEMNTEKANEFEKSVKQYLVQVGVFIKGGGEQKSSGGKSKDLSDQLSSNFDKRVNSPLNSQKSTSPQKAKVKYKIESYVEEQFDNEDINKIFADIANDVSGVRLSLLSNKLFLPGQVKLKKSAIKIVDKIGRFLASNSHRIFIEGHSTFNENSRNYTSGWDLAAARASLLVRYMIKVHKISDKRLVAISQGGIRPFDNSDIKSARNQRIDFLVVTEPLPF